MVNVLKKSICTVTSSKTAFQNSQCVRFRRSLVITEMNSFLPAFLQRHIFSSYGRIEQSDGCSSISVDDSSH